MKYPFTHVLPSKFTKRKVMSVMLKISNLSMMSIDCWHVTDGNTVRGVGRFREETFFVHHLNTIQRLNRFLRLSNFKRQLFFRPKLPVWIQTQPRTEKSSKNGMDYQ